VRGRARGICDAGSKELPFRATSPSPAGASGSGCSPKKQSNGVARRAAEGGAELARVAADATRGAAVEAAADAANVSGVDDGGMAMEGPPCASWPHVHNTNSSGKQE